MDVYREELLDHWRNPNNFGKISEADLVIEQINPLCGDRVVFYFRLSKGKGLSRTIKDVRFEGSGCAISIASSSILSENIKNKSLKILLDLTGKEVLEMIGGGIAPARLKCAFLPFEAIKRLNGRKKGQEIQN